MDGVEGERAGSGDTPAPDSAGFRGVRPDGGSCWRRPGEPCFCGAVPAVTAEGALSMATGESRGSPAPGRRLGTGLASAAAPTKRLRFVPAVIIFISEQHAARRLSIASIETPRASAAATDACTDAMSATADMPPRRGTLTQARNSRNGIHARLSQFIWTPGHTQPKTAILDQRLSAAFTPHAVKVDEFFSSQRLSTATRVPVGLGARPRVPTSAPSYRSIASGGRVRLHSQTTPATATYAATQSPIAVRNGCSRSRGASSHEPEI